MTDPRELLDQYRNGFAKRARAALRAVLDLHKPEGPFVECATCRMDTGQPEDWPCPTVQAITTALGGDQ